jgi:putative transposase
MANLAASTIDDLTRVTRYRLKSMQYRPTFADGFLAATGLALP